MTLTAIVAGQRAVVSDVNQIINLLTGVTGSGTTLTLINNAESLIFQPSSDPSAGTRVWTVKNNAGTVLASMRFDGLLKLLSAAAAPATPVTGSLYWDSVLTALRVYDGAAWQPITFGRTRNIWRGAQDHILRTGTPALGLQGTNTLYEAWAFDAAAAELINSEFVLPEDWVSGNIVAKLHWTNLGAGAGNVVWYIELEGLSDGDNINNGATSVNTQATFAAGTQDVLKISTLSPAIAGVASRFFRYRVQRVAGDAADTLANDAGLIGVEFEYTAVI